ncbi:MAG: PAS domain-containing protein [Planctomycetes bacterium]|nr:PAS domain-containing protein [Planctomycetota bacterium]
MSETRALSDIIQENRRLRQKVFELEEQLARKPSSPSLPAVQLPARPPDGPGSRVLQLVRQKDQTLGVYARELEEKAERLEESLEEMRKKNLELNHWLAALKLYQEIFENEPAAIVGFDPDRNVMHYNRAAVECLGESIHSSILNDVLSLPLADRVGSDLPALVQEAMEAQAPRERVIRSGNGEFHALVFPLLGENGLRGGVLRVMRTRG